MENRVEEVFNDVFKGIVAYSRDLSRETENKWDSMKHIELLIAFEKEFGLRFDGSDATEMNSINKIIEVIESRC